MLICITRHLFVGNQFKKILFTKLRRRLTQEKKCAAPNLLREETQVKSNTAILRICKEKNYGLLWFTVVLSYLCVHTVCTFLCTYLCAYARL
jgi:hypothetical protein